MYGGGTSSSVRRWLGSGPTYRDADARGATSLARRGRPRVAFDGSTMPIPGVLSDSPVAILTGGVRSQPVTIRSGQSLYVFRIVREREVARSGAAPYNRRMLAATNWALWGVVMAGVAAFATVYMAWRTRGSWLAQQLNVKAKVTPLMLPVPTATGVVNVQFLRMDLYNKSSSDIGVQGWSVSAPQGWFIQARPIQTPLPPPTFPNTLRGKHSFRWDSPLVATLLPGLTHPPGNYVVPIHVTFEFGEETTLTLGPVNVPAEIAPPQVNQPTPQQQSSQQARPMTPAVARLRERIRRGEIPRAGG
jgi:hypothetical protein